VKAVGILEYGVEDVFHVFIKTAKKDFKDFDEEDATGSKIVKTINSLHNPVECTVEITGYVKNEKYEITTSTSYSTCVSTYNFKGQKDGTTKVSFEENQSTNKFFGYISLYVQRFLVRRAFKAKYKQILESLDNELKTYFSNIERSKPKDKALAD
jgi:hypothetical protein